MSQQRVEVGPFAFNFKDILLPMGLNVANVDVQGFGGTIVAKPFSLQLVQPGTMKADVEEADLASFLEKLSPGGLHEFSISAQGGKLSVRAKKTVLVDLKVSATATLRIKDGKQLWIDVESVDVMGAGAKNLVQGPIDKINPVLDAADLPVDATLTSVEIADGRVTLYGTVEPR